MTQIIHGIIRKIRGGALGLSVLLSACGGMPEALPESAPDVVPAPNTAALAPADDPDDPPPVVPWNTDPMGAWHLADSLAEFHATWTAYASLTARGRPAPDALVPYADAAEHHGASWGLTTPAPALVLFHADGHAYRYPSGAHGLNPAAEEREPVEMATLEELGLEALRDGEDIHVRFAGNTLHMLGAHRASGSCGECHEGPIDTLLGAHVYAFYEIADD